MASKDILVKKIKSGQIMKGYSTKELAIKMHLTQGALNRRFRYPNRITVEDLRKFEQVLDIKLLA